jgi:hypothetical protein
MRSLLSHCCMSTCRNSDQLIPHMFNFLVLLSYERYHSKTIVQIPKIIQLCDGIMASGQDPATHGQCTSFVGCSVVRSRD